jgi:hypothetical protein
MVGSGAASSSGESIMKIAAAAVMAVFLAVPTTALAFSLVEETVGNAPMVKRPDWHEGILDIVNLPTRVHATRSVGDLVNIVEENFFYQGDARALSEALRKFAAVKTDDRQLILLPGRGKLRSRMVKTVEFDWQLQVHNGDSKEVTGSRHAVLTVFVSMVRPQGRPDRIRIERLIGELGKESFEKRQDAERELQTLEREARPFLRAALKARKELEVLRRIERLLARLPGLDAGDLEIPPGMPALTATDLFAEHCKGLFDRDLTRCSRAAHGLIRLAPHNARVVPALTDLLKKNHKELIRRVAAACLGSIGARAKPALPALKMGSDDRDPNIRIAFQGAIDEIDKARNDAEPDEEVKKRMAILTELDDFNKAREK